MSIVKGEDSPLSKQSLQLAITIVEYYKWLTECRKEFVMSKQILRSGTSIGANVHEANYAASRADFVNKLRIALKETAETEYWFKILSETGCFDSQYQPAIDLLVSVKRLLVASINTASRKQ